MKRTTQVVCALAALLDVTALPTTALADGRDYTDGPSSTSPRSARSTGISTTTCTGWRRPSRQEQEAAKKAGLILDYRVLVVEARGPNDPDIYLVTEYKNWAALDRPGRQVRCSSSPRSRARSKRPTSPRPTAPRSARCSARAPNRKRFSSKRSGADPLRRHTGGRHFSAVRRCLCIVWSCAHAQASCAARRREIITRRSHEPYPRDIVGCTGSPCSERRRERWSPRRTRRARRMPRLRSRRSPSASWRRSSQGSVDPS